MRADARLRRLEQRFCPPMEYRVVMPLDWPGGLTDQQRAESLDWERGGEERARRAGHRIYGIPREVNV